MFPKGEGVSRGGKKRKLEVERELVGGLKCNLNMHIFDKIIVQHVTKIKAMIKPIVYSDLPSTFFAKKRCLASKLFLHEFVPL